MATPRKDPKDYLKEGRPTLYHNGVLSECEEYIAINSSAPSLPTIEGLSLHLGVSDDTMADWCEKHPEFRAAYKRVFKLQKNQLMVDGMYGGKEVNSAMAIFLLKANHGMIETERKLLGNDSDEPLRVRLDTE